jgi:hypothetical protein
LVPLDKSSNNPETQRSQNQDESTLPLVGKDSVPKRSLKLQLSLLDKTSIQGTDIMSFNFSRTDQQNYLNYKAGRYSVVDLGTREDPEGSTRSFTIASSQSEKEFILISTRIRYTFQKEISKP